ncbi:MAG: DsbA family oxidoreductase [Tannerellaceae bacterium]|jgi:predicted DsbA family dithiol-disulfide isomerase|nr:DsbA family oxidoreductase [Tannerellaceae bacterium]
MDKMKIDIWSDIACPYCYIGKRKLRNALAQFPHAGEIELVRHSYELNPDLPKAPLGKSIYAYLAGQNGIAEEVQREKMKSILSLAESVGLAYDLDRVVVTNTSDALRLICLAQERRLGSEVEEALFKAYFIDGETVSDPATLLKLGLGAGLQESEIKEMLAGGLYLDKIKEDIRYSEDCLDLQYIPFYLFNNNHIIQGSLAEEAYLEVLNKAYNDWKQNGISEENGGERFTGKACSIDGVCN